LCERGALSCMNAWTFIQSNILFNYFIIVLLQSCIPRLHWCSGFERSHKIYRVHALVLVYAKMQMRWRVSCIAGVSHCTKSITFFDLRSRNNQLLVKVGEVIGVAPLLILHPYNISSQPSRCNTSNQSIGRCYYWRSLFRKDVDAFMFPFTSFS